jgi:hypothetical protein
MMALELLEFLLILAVAFGALCFLIGPNQGASGWRANERHVGAAVIGIVVASATLVAMLVGPVPMVLLVVALVALIADRQSSKEPLNWRALSDFARGLMELIAQLKKRVPELMASVDLGRVCRHQAFAAVQRTLETGIAKSTERLRPFVQGVALKYKKARASRREALFHAEQPPVSANLSGIEAVFPIGADTATQPAADAEVNVVPRQSPRPLTHDQVRLLLSVIEGSHTRRAG